MLWMIQHVSADWPSYKRKETDSSAILCNIDVGSSDAIDHQPSIAFAGQKWATYR